MIHRLDAELTVGAVTDLDPELATDGVLEVLDPMYAALHATWMRGCGTVRPALM